MTFDRRGLLIVVEGCDRAGKSSQCELLVKHLTDQGVKTVLMKYPDRESSETGRLIDAYLKGSKTINDQAVHLLFSANRWESMERLDALLKSNTTVVVDRYTYSGAAYSAAKGLDLEWCKQPDVGLLKPDCVILLDIDPVVASQRQEYGAERYEQLELQQRVRSNFHLLHKADSSVTPWHIIDASQSKLKIAHQMQTIATSFIINKNQQ